ncbi:MAG: hypothetical protein NTZ16_10890 [Verrucomicrobia bacterium]|nr:hypothetical protein [Verrucomicrobiota bacterium]
MKTNPLAQKIKQASLVLAVMLGIQTIASAASEMALDHPQAKAVLAVQKSVTADLMKLPGVLGTAVGVDDADTAALVVYVDQDSPARADIVRSLPPQIRGVGVKVEMTDKFRAFAKPSGGSTISYTAKQTPPIQLGTSGGWSYDLANGYCCGGTLGSLIQVNGVQYIMSNYHVLEADTVSGGNSIVATTGQPVVQPGLIDVNCTAANAQAVGTLVKISSLPGANVDVAVAQVTPGMVSASGSILGIGTISSNTVAATLNKAVKKSGRTTGTTTSSISGLNATVSITYENECAGGTAFTKTFTGQIVIANKGSRFLNSGDSGSLMVENVATKPRAVGLLYAGSSSTAIANPINEVLTFVGSQLGGTATMVGN